MDTYVSHDSQVPDRCYLVLCMSSDSLWDKDDGCGQGGVVYLRERALGKDAAKDDQYGGSR